MEDYAVGSDVSIFLGLIRMNTFDVFSWKDLSALLAPNAKDSHAKVLTSVDTIHTNLESDNVNSVLTCMFLVFCHILLHFLIAINTLFCTQTYTTQK